MSGAVDRSLIEARIAQLREELARGTARLGEIEAEAERLRETLLRISGAIQVLSQVIAEAEAAARDEGQAAP